MPDVFVRLDHEVQQKHRVERLLAQMSEDASRQFRSTRIERYWKLPEQFQAAIHPPFHHHVA